MTLLASGSIPEVGSSRRTTLDLPMRATPRWTFRFMPPRIKKKLLISFHQVSGNWHFLIMSEQVMLSTLQLSKCSTFKINSEVH